MGSTGYARDSKKKEEKKRVREREKEIEREGCPGNTAQFSGRLVTEKRFGDKKLRRARAEVNCQSDGRKSLRRGRRARIPKRFSIPGQPGGSTSRTRCESARFTKYVRLNYSSAPPYSRNLSFPERREYLARERDSERENPVPFKSYFTASLRIGRKQMRINCREYLPFACFTSRTTDGTRVRIHARDGFFGKYGVRVAKILTIPLRSCDRKREIARKMLERERVNRLGRFARAQETRDRSLILAAADAVHFFRHADRATVRVCGFTRGLKIIKKREN